MRTLIVLISTLFFVVDVYGQTPDFVEHFDYGAGALGSVTASWVCYSGTQGQVQVVNTSGDVGSSLAFPGYQTPSGNRISISSTKSEDIGRVLSDSATSGSVNVSLLMKVTTLPSASGTYFFNFLQTLPGTNFGGTVWTRKSGLGFQLGINARTVDSTTQWLSKSFNLNETYLVVVRYSFNTGDSNDVASLWVNPSLTGGEPVPDASAINHRGKDLQSITAVGLRENTGMGTIEIDEIRVGRTWSDTPLPVTMRGVSARVGEEGVIVSFSTASEIDIAGFNIMRASSAEGPFELISGYASNPALTASANNSSGRSYSFIDKKVSTGKTYYYSISSVDRSGKMEQAGEIVEVFVNSPESFSVRQNYPNPFNPATSIGYQLSTAGYVSLKVFDVLGREVATLTDGIQSAGYYKAEFNGEKYSSGIYFYRLRFESTAGERQSVVRKMMLAK